VTTGLVTVGTVRVGIVLVATGLVVVVVSGAAVVVSGSVAAVSAGTVGVLAVGSATEGYVRVASVRVASASPPPPPHEVRATAARKPRAATPRNPAVLNGAIEVTVLPGGVAD
jgi:hypothetical protein